MSHDLYFFAIFNGFPSIIHIISFNFYNFPSLFRFYFYNSCVILFTSIMNKMA